MSDRPTITVWNENRHEQQNDAVADIYPDGIHEAIARPLKDRADIGTVRCATLDEPRHGLDTGTIQDTDVLVWWSHIAHDEVTDGVVRRVHEAVLEGMGLLVLHSAMGSRIFRRLMGTSGRVKWREDGRMERVWSVNPAHPISRGVGEQFEIPTTEMYGEPFDIPPPDELVFISWFAGGEVLRSGCCYYRGSGRIFYFRPGHETYPVYHQKEVQDVIHRACLWAAPRADWSPEFGHADTAGGL
ncbi:MAG: ThuA domain-containing protein [Planctomycetota bacterium]